MSIKVLKIQTVCRVEHQDSGIGPYNSDNRTREIRELMSQHYCGIHPAPYEDEGIDRCIDETIEFCGFKSMQQLRQWFTVEELTTLEHGDFHIVKHYGARVTAIGKAQVLFIPQEKWEQLDEFAQEALTKGTFEP